MITIHILYYLGAETFITLTVRIFLLSVNM